MIIELIQEHDEGSELSSARFHHVATYQAGAFLVLVGKFAFSSGVGHYDEGTHLQIVTPPGQPEPTWSQIQAIKNAIVGDEVWAYQAYPPESALIDDADIYHVFCGIQPPITL